MGYSQLEDSLRKNQVVVDELQAQVEECEEMDECEETHEEELLQYSNEVKRLFENERKQKDKMKALIMDKNDKIINLSKCDLCMARKRQSRMKNVAKSTNDVGLTGLKP